MAGAAAPMPALVTTAAAPAPSVFDTPPAYVPVRPGWAPPAPPMPPPLPPALAAASQGRMLSGRALLLVGVAVGVGAVGMLASTLLGRDTNLEPAAYIRYAIVITLAVYGLVAALVVTQITPTIRLRWHTGRPLHGVGIGLAVGGGLSALLLLVVSVAAGHLAPDPRIVTLMSEGDASHLLVAVFISCLCAPLVEEVLFRGLLLESQRARSTALAVWISAAAFAVWHLNPGALRYYALMGALLGQLYVKRGLVCSMAAHFAFNGVLTAAAIAAVLSSGIDVRSAGMELHAPGGWRVVHTNDIGDAAAVELRGPSGAWLGAIEVATPVGTTTDQMLTRLEQGSSPLGGYAEIEKTTARIKRVPAGRVLEVDVTADGHRGVLALLPRDGGSLEFLFLSAGSVRATTDFDRILDSVSMR
jgi:membrane protease YdiL (CAAX protease family)